MSHVVNMMDVEGNNLGTLALILSTRGFCFISNMNLVAVGAVDGGDTNPRVLLFSMEKFTVNGTLNCDGGQGDTQDCTFINVPSDADAVVSIALDERDGEILVSTLKRQVLRL